MTELLRTTPDLMRDARALAVFSCAASGVLEAVALPRPVAPMAVVDTAFWLEPLAETATTENWGVMVLSRRAGRLFRGGRDSLVEFATFEDDLHRRHAQGGMSQARFQRGIEQQVAEHARRAAELMQRAHRRRPFDHVAVVAADELWPVVEDALSSDVQARLAGRVTHDLEHAAPEEIARAVAPVIETAEHERERELLARLEQGLGTGGPAAAGLDEVLALLEAHRVELLLLAEHAGIAPEEADAIERAVETAARESVEIVVVRHEEAALREHGSIAALLRW